MAARTMDSRFAMALLLCAGVGLTGCSDKESLASAFCTPDDPGLDDLAAECDDGNECTLSLCTNNACNRPPKDDDTPCGFSGMCSAGVCVDGGTGGTGGAGGTGGMAGTGGAGGTGGTTGSGGFTIEGQVIDDAMVGLDGVNVRAILGAAGITSVFTDNGGLFALQVNEVGDYRLCAVGAISDSLPRRFVSTNCEEGDDEVTVSESSNDPPFSEVSITSGYYMEVTNAPFTFVDEPQGGDIMLRMNYRVWNRASVPNTTTHIVVGIEGVAQFAHPVGNAGPYSPSMQTTGMADVTLIASVGTIYARFLPLDAQDAIDAYNNGFSTARETNYVAIGTVTTQ